MVLKSMDDLLIEIQNIKELESIKIYDIVRSSNKSGKLEATPTIMITYGGGKVLNLSADELYFDIFAKKVTEVYHDEKNNILEDSLTDPFKLRRSLSIDEHTKEILESGLLTRVNEIYSFYDGKSSYEDSLLYEIDEVKSFIPIVLYHLNRLFDKTNISIKFNNDLNGYRTLYSVSAEVNTIPKNFIIEYDKVSDNEYNFRINGILDKCKSVNVNIKYLNDRISVNITLDNMDLNSTTEYVVNDKNIKCIEKMYRGYLPIFYENKDLEECENDKETLTNMDCNMPCKWYRLPWNALYGTYSDIRPISETEKMIETYCVYLDSSNKSFFKKENYSKSYLRNNTTALKSEKVSLDEMIKNTTGIRLFGNIYLIETLFLDKLSPSGYYNGNLKGRYFYHLVKSNGEISDIDLNTMTNISSKDIYEKANLLNENRVLSLVMGDK